VGVTTTMAMMMATLGDGVDDDIMPLFARKARMGL
jgi:hypothetical protein